MSNMDTYKFRRELYIRLLRLVFGLFLYALGIVVTLKAHVGFAPWDVLHVGLSKTTGMTIGLASILVGILIVAVAFFLGEKLGVGTILNMILIGVFLDFILKLNVIPVMNYFLAGFIMLIVGLFIISLATYFYIGSGFGAGPRDSLMVALARKTKQPIGLCRGIIEVVAVIVGWQLGGMVGIGTVIAAFAVGICIQITFRLLKFDAKKVDHQTLAGTYKAIFRSV
jgi:uncharacterized membrane protein YczE